MKKLLIGLVMLPLCGCLNSTQSSDPTTVFGTVQSGYDAYVGSEVVYLKSGKATKSVTDQLEAARLAAWAVIGPIQTEIQSGSTPTSSQALAAQAAELSFSQVVQDLTGSK